MYVVLALLQPFKVTSNTVPLIIQLHLIINLTYDQRQWRPSPVVGGRMGPESKM